MDTVNDKYFNWVCRACLRELVETTIANEEEQRGLWQSIFDQVAECDGTQSIAELLTNTISEIEVNPGDNLSKKICHECIYKLTNMRRFQQMCIQSDREMRAMIAIIDATDIPTVKQELNLPKEQQQIIPDPLQNIGEAIETCAEMLHEDVNNFVKNEPFDNNDNHEEALLSTITVEQEKKHSHNSWVCETERPGLISAQGQSTPLHSQNPPGSVLILQQQIEEKVVTAAKCESSPHVCALCSKEFRESRYLKRHMQRHAQPIEEKKKEKLTPKTFSCTECSKLFSKLEGLKEHMIRHRDERPFECPICPARFVCKGTLIKHKVIHDVIKRFMCDICGEDFRRNTQLRLHKKWHNGEKPYKCDYCEMRFVRAADKRRHMLTHTGEKPYKCKYCERAFAQSNDHVKHLRTHLGENTYWCTLCPSAFRLASERRAHFVTHKNDDEETRERNMKALKDKEAKLQLKLCKKRS